MLPVVNLLTVMPASALALIALTSSLEKVLSASDDRAFSCVEDMTAICALVSAAALVLLRLVRAAAERPAIAWVLMDPISAVEKRASSALSSVASWAELRPAI